MSELVDARGLSCPQPVLETLEAIGRMGSGEIEVLVDTDASKENVTRAAAAKGWQLKDDSSEGDGFRLVLAKA